MMKAGKLLLYRMKMRKALTNASIEELRICLDEVKREIQNRNKKK